MEIKIFCLCNLFPCWSGYGIISTPVYGVLELSRQKTWLCRKVLPLYLEWRFKANQVVVLEMRDQVRVCVRTNRRRRH